MTWKPHVTVAAVVEKNRRFLMVEEHCENRILFNQPAGHLEPDENLLQAVVRETLEETAWTIKPRAIIGIRLWQHPDLKQDLTFLRISFAGDCVSHDPERPLDDGILQALWLSLEDLEARQAHLRSPMVLLDVKDYLTGTRYPLSLLTSLLPGAQNL